MMKTQSVHRRHVFTRLNLYLKNGKRPMNRTLIILMTALLAHSPAHAISAKYRQQLERSGCTQVSEAQGCDITKSKQENAKAGFGAPTPAKDSKDSKSPYAGLWVAKAKSGSTMDTIRIDSHDKVWVSGKRVNAKRSDGALIFHKGSITYTLQGDRRLKGEDYWVDSKTGTRGLIKTE